MGEIGHLRPESFDRRQGLLEVEVGGVRLVPEGSPARNPAFDVTPARLVTGFVTEDGLFAPAEFRERVARR